MIIEGPSAIQDFRKGYDPDRINTAVAAIGYQMHLSTIESVTILPQARCRLILDFLRNSTDHDAFDWPRMDDQPPLSLRQCLQTNDAIGSNHPWTSTWCS